MVINIYMKSGNKIRVHGVKRYEFKNYGNTVNSIFIERTFLSKLFGYGECLVVSTIDLSQIEAVTVG